jgi:thiol-disulfide isomerase/thioredoxin
MGVLLGLVALPAAFGLLARAADGPKAAEVAVSEVKADGLEKAVADRKGKVVLIDFWATWCGPCVKKFPHLVQTQKKFRDRGLVCMSVSMDPRGEKDKYDKGEVLKFLKDKGATFPNYVLLGYAADGEKVDRHFGLEGGIPFMVLFDKAGRRVWTSEEKKLGDEELDRLIEDQLTK